MSSFIIEGNHRLSGDITPQGAKNEALQVLCATLLTEEPVTMVVELSANELKVTDVEGNGDDAEMYKQILPMVFTK